MILPTMETGFHDGNTTSKTARLYPCPRMVARLRSDSPSKLVQNGICECHSAGRALANHPAMPGAKPNPRL